MVAVARLGAAVGNQLHAEGGLEVVRGLRRVADHEHQGIPAGYREPVLGLVVLHQPNELLELLEVEVGVTLFGREGDRVGHELTVNQRGRAVQATPCRRSRPSAQRRAEAAASPAELSCGPTVLASRETIETTPREASSPVMPT